jgi:hypothetical protein
MGNYNIRGMGWTADEAIANLVKQIEAAGYKIRKAREPGIRGYDTVYYVDGGWTGRPYYMYVERVLDPYTREPFWIARFWHYPVLDPFVYDKQITAGAKASVSHDGANLGLWCDGARRHQ